MPRIYTLLAVALMALAATAQELPQFNSKNYEGWSYNNPAIPLSTSSIGGGRITLYVNSAGVALTLTSPQFGCNGLDSINAVVKWYCQNFALGSFVLDRATLTLAIDDDSGNPLDSVTFVPMTAGVSTYTVDMTLPVPRGLDQARLRFVSWTGDVISSGAIKSAALTAIAASHDEWIPGDVNSNGRLDISDVTALISYLTGANTDIDTRAADNDGTPGITIGDVTALIAKLLNGAASP